MKFRVLLMLLLMNILPISVPAQQSPGRSGDEAEIRQVVQAFIETRERNDRDGLAALLTADVDQLVTTGRMRSGREAVVDGSLNTTAGTGGSRRIAIETIRFLGPDVAIGDGPYDVVDTAAGPDRHYLTTMIFQRISGDWKITAVRNMQPRQ
ncbi:MAG: SgcJ/EcaC family oxidoreductase [Gammaproteobacteria bacterium]